MKCSNREKIRFMFVGVVAALALGGGSANADFTFGAPVHLGPPISSPYGEGGDSITADGLEMYLSCYNKPGGLGAWDIWVSKRETANDDWGEPENIGAPINTGQSDSCAETSPDGLEMYFVAYNRPGGYGDCDIWVTRRATRNDPWAPPENLGPLVNTSSFDQSFRISPDGLELYFSSSRPGGYGAEDLWVTKRATKNDPWGAPVNLGPPVNSSASENYPSLSSDGLLLIFSGYRDTVGSHRPGGYGSADIWVARRASVSDPWGTPVNLGPMVNSPSLDCAGPLSPDGRTLYFSSERPGGLGGPYGDIYQVPILPIVDFNGDNKVAIEDLLVLIDHWGQSEPLCDIGPMPWGDGIVDAQDLEVLMRHWEQDPYDPTLIACWGLDEAEGLVAADSAGTNDGTLLGQPLWQAAGGKIGGALQFDGALCVITTKLVHDPATGPFSALAWVKGGAPEQVILSQASGADWLMASTPAGVLTTGLSMGGRTGKPLAAAAVMADGAWHRVGFVWDGRNRILYVNGIEVARESQTRLAASAGGLQIGAGSTLAPGTFFSGLIDDVRVYNRAVKP